MPYVYDSLYRLTSFEREVPLADVGTPGLNHQQSKRDWQLDGVQNWGIVTTNGSSVTNAVNDVNEYSSFGGVSPAYDADGNETFPDTGAAQQVMFKYDCLNRLSQIVSGSAIVSHYYDADGRRVRTTTSGVADAPADVRYVYDGWQVLEETNASGVIMRRYVMGVKLDEFLRLENLCCYPGPGTYYYQQNTIGSVVALANPDGVVMERYAYDAYGSPRFEDANNLVVVRSQSACGNPYLFTGRRYEPAITAIYECRHRVYNPLQGQFLQRDTIGMWGDRVELGNAYCYAADAPINRLDPYGLTVYKTSRPVEQDDYYQQAAWTVLGKSGVNHVGLLVKTSDGNKTSFDGEEKTNKMLMVDENAQNGKEKKEIVPPPPGETQEEWDRQVLDAGAEVEKELGTPFTRGEPGKEGSYWAFPGRIGNDCETVQEMILEKAYAKWEARHPVAARKKKAEDHRKRVEEALDRHGPF